MIDIAVCIAVFNRRERTLACLASLFAAELPASARLSVFLLDDASTDGTGEAVRAIYPLVNQIQGDGHRYWAGGMRLAYGAALEGPYSHFIWLNDDVVLTPDALVKLFATQDSVRAGADVIVVAAMRDSADGAITYSGLVKGPGLRPWKLERRIPDAERPVPCDTINGNLVLIPRALALRLGNIDPVFTHAFGDIDYGFRARRAGATLWVAAGHCGYCAANVSRPRWKKAGLSFAERIRLITSPLGVPPKDQFVYAFRHFGLVGLIVFAEPYLAMATSHFLSKRS